MNAEAYFGSVALPDDINYGCIFSLILCLVTFSLAGTRM